MRAASCVIAIIVCSLCLPAAAQDDAEKNRELIQGLVAEVVAAVNEINGIKNPAEQLARYKELDASVRRPYWKAKVHLDVTEVHREADRSGHVIVAPAAELPDNLPPEFSYTNKIAMKHLSKDAADRIAVGDQIIVEGDMNCGATGVGANTHGFFVFVLPDKQPKQMMFILALVRPKISSSVDP